jgi:uncharacterized protein with HEPN domain
VRTGACCWTTCWTRRRRRSVWPNGLEKDDFVGDRVLVDAAIKNLSVLGEAATRVPDEVAEQWPDLPWRMMRDMRNFIVHEYFGVSADVVWGTIREDLPDVVVELRRVIGER